MILLTLPIFAWFLADERRHHQQLITALIEEAARQLKLGRYQIEQSANASAQVATTPREMPANP